jgi:exportin-1
MDGSEYSWHNLNTLCWAIGSISGAMQVDDEKRFLVSVIKNLLCLVEEKRGKKHKAIIASNIMYIVGQYPRFLKAHWKFLKTVVKKLFEFMHERHEGVQDMACDTFMKIAIKCKRLFVTTQMSEVEPYVYEIIQTMSMITLDLTPSQVHTFYEAVGQTISAEADEQKCSFLITKLMESANLRWSTIISQAANNIDVLRDHDTVVQLVNILKTNTAACRSIGHPFITQLSVIYFDMLHVYKTMSENVQQAISSPHVVMADLLRAMRLARREILKLIGCWVSRSRDSQQVVENFIPPLLDAVLSDYNTSIPEARDHEVLSCMATIVNRLQSAMAPYTIQIFAATFESTLGMITQVRRGGNWRDMEELNLTCRSFCPQDSPLLPPSIPTPSSSVPDAT